MKRIIFLLALFSTTAQAQIVYLNLTFTNAAGASNGSVITINASTRIATNPVSGSPSTLWKATNSAAIAATNLYTHLAIYPVANTFVRMTNATNVQVYTKSGGTIAYSITGDYAFGGLSTSAVTRVGEIVTTDQTQTLSNKTMYGMSAASPYTTNLVNQGNAISSPGTGTDSEQFGSGAEAIGDYSTAVGYISKATNLNSTALGYKSHAYGTNSLALGYEAAASETYSMAIGQGAEALGSNSFALGFDATASHADSVAIGPGAATTTNNQIIIGAATHTVEIGGNLNVGLTNFVNYFFGTNATISGGTISGVSLIANTLYSVAGALTNITAQISTGWITNLYAYGGSLTNVAIDSTSITTATLRANSGQITNVSGAFSGATITNLQALSGSISNAAIVNSSHTNSTFTGTNIQAGMWVTPFQAFSSLANGQNRLTLNTNSCAIRLSGPTGAWSIDGIVGGSDGREIALYNKSGQTLTLTHESGWEGTAGNRIVSPNGANMTITNAVIVDLIYDGTDSRWIIKRP